ncbi:MAG: CheB methylesterase domain-containing protein, partial [Brevundimonas sp.]
ARPAVVAPPRTPPLGRAAPRVLAIGGSTGAPPVLMTLFESLRGVTQPILVTQHMPAGFTSLLAEQLSRAGERPCAEAKDGETILAGRAYVAPGGWHMTVASGAGGPMIRLNQEPPEHFCRPAVDPMLRTASEVYGNGLMAVILTGMGSDGAEGCRAVVEHGGRFIVQDEATSVVWGMPGAAARTGLVEAVLPLDRISPYIRQAVGAAL